MALQVRALDNVLDVTFWPLPQQRDEAMAKRRIGVGFTGMGNTLAMLCLRYDLPEGRTMAARIAEGMRDAAYAVSVELAREKGAFPKFDARGYLARGVPLPAVCPSRSKRRSVSTASATATCCLLPPPAR